MELKLTIQLEQLFHLAEQLPAAEKQQMITNLQKTMKQSKSQEGERELGKYEGKIYLSDDFNAPLEDFKEYMQ